MLPRLTKKMMDYGALSLYRERTPVICGQQKIMQQGNKQYINFCDNNYLGLANHPDVVSALKQGADKFGVGSGSSNLITGHSPVHQAFEEAFAGFVGAERALLFSTGYMANLGVITALLTREDALFQDKDNHASLIDAGVLSRAKVCRYQHLDVAHLSTLLLKTNYQNKLIVTDSVFSMSGELAPIEQLLTLSKQHQAMLFIDEAHGFGVMGKQGRGLCYAIADTCPDTLLRVFPLGKALGCFGAIIAGKSDVIESLIQFSRSYIYTTAIPPAIANAGLTSLNLLQTESWRQEKLKNLIKTFTMGAKDRGLRLLPSETAIQGFVVGESKKALLLSQKLKSQGIWLTAIRPPTVLQGKARLRITLSAEHTETQIEKLLDCLLVAYQEVEQIFYEAAN